MPNFSRARINRAKKLLRTVGWIKNAYCKTSKGRLYDVSPEQFNAYYHANPAAFTGFCAAGALIATKPNSMPSEDCVSMPVGRLLLLNDAPLTTLQDILAALDALAPA